MIWFLRHRGEKSTSAASWTLSTHTCPDGLVRTLTPKLNRRRALFVLAKIDQILAWEREVDNQRDTRFVELGRYLCEVRAGQCWRLENLSSFESRSDRLAFPGQLKPV